MAPATASSPKPVKEAFVFPASFAQRRLWFLHQIDPSSSAYNIIAPLSIAAPLNAEALQLSLKEIVRRHETLRTTFRSVDGEPVQVVSLVPEFQLNFFDLSQLPPALLHETAIALACREAARPFSLSRGPLLRAFLLRLKPELHVLLLTMHHIISDGWSLGVLLQEASTLYRAYCDGEHS